MHCRELFSLTPEEQGGDLWIDYAYWDKAQVTERPPWVDGDQGVKLFLGLDLGLIRAFTALGCCWLHPDGKAHVEVLMYTHRKEPASSAALPADWIWSRCLTDGVFLATPGEYCDLRYMVQGYQATERRL